MKKIVCLLVVIFILSVQTILGESSFYELNGGRAEAIVVDPLEQLENDIIYSDNSIEIVNFSHELLYLSGALVKNTEIEIINNTSYIDVNTINNMAGYSVNKNNDGTVIVSKGENSILIKDIKVINENICIPLRYTFENLKMNVSYYGITDRNSVSLVPNRVSIYIDDIYTDYESVESGLINSKKICLEGFENYKNGLVENNPEVYFDDEFLMIEKCINDMSYIGEVSRYYVFDMTVYRVVYDKISGEVYFDYNTGLCTFVKLVDVNYSGLYTPLFIIG